MHIKEPIKFLQANLQLFAGVEHSSTSGKKCHNQWSKLHWKGVIRYLDSAAHQVLMYIHTGKYNGKNPVRCGIEKRNGGSFPDTHPHLRKLASNREQTRRHNRTRNLLQHWSTYHYGIYWTRRTHCRLEWSVSELSANNQISPCIIATHQHIWDLYYRVWIP